MEEPDNVTHHLSTARVSLEDLVHEQALTASVAPWLRLAWWCWAHANEHGHAPTFSGQLRVLLGLSTADDVTRAVHLARKNGLIDPCSTSACLVLRGHALSPCDVTRHRDPS